jgi:hypothetical protein
MGIVKRADEILEPLSELFKSLIHSTQRYLLKPYVAFSVRIILIHVCRLTADKIGC